MSKRLVFIVLIVGIVLTSLFLIPWTLRTISLTTLKAGLPVDIVSSLRLNTVTTQSNIDEYQLVLNDKQYLLNHAREVGIFKSSGVDLPGVENIKDNYPSEFFHSLITDINIVLSYNIVDSPSEKSVVLDTSPLNTSTQFDKSRVLTITVPLLPLQIQKAQSDPTEFEKINRAINAVVLNTLDSLVDKNGTEEKYFQYYRDLNSLSQINQLPLILISR